MTTPTEENPQIHNGFTLLEAIVALSIGVVILTTLAVAINQVTESITRTERMALQNRLLNAGIMRAMEDADSWSSLDATGFQPLRPSPANLKAVSPLGNGAAVTVRIPSDTSPSTAVSYPAAAADLLYGSNASDWNKRGQPFTAFQDVIVANPTTRATTWTNPYRSEVSDHPDARYWQPCFKQSWYRGDGAMWMSGATGSTAFSHLSAYGNYAIFANCTDDYVLVGSYDGTKNATKLDSKLIVPASHRFVPAMHKLFKYTLGWYGWFDYLPANTFIDYYEVWGDYGNLNHSNRGHGNNADGVDPDNPGHAPREDTDPTYDDETHPQHMDYNGSNATVAGLRPIEIRDLPDGVQPPADASGLLREILNANRHGQFSKQRSSGVMPLTKTGAERAVTVGWYPYAIHIGICAPTPTEWATYGTSDPLHETIRKATTINRYMGMGYSSGAELVNTFPTMLGCMNKSQNLVATKPSAWPTVTWGTRRFMKWGNMSTWCYVRMFDPISGKSSELQFPTIATTLRGARLARGLDLVP